MLSVKRSKDGSNVCESKIAQRASDSRKLGSCLRIKADIIDQMPNASLKTSVNN